MRILALTLFVLCFYGETLNASEITGRTIVIQGDIIKIDGQVIQLLDIDAPETYQICYHANGQDFLCGDEAHIFLLDLIGTQQVVCSYDKLDQKDRPLATCFVGSKNLNREMVKAGWALPFYGTKHYLKERDAAKAAKRGIWEGTFCEPRILRRNECPAQ